MNVLDLLKRDGIEPRLVSNAKGGEFHSMCPGCRDSGHDPRTGPSNRFHVWPAANGGEGSWWCRQCDKGGDNIEYLIFYHGMGFREAAEAVGRDVTEACGPRSEAGNYGPVEKPEWRPAEMEEGGAADVELYRKKLRKFAGWCHEKLLHSSEQMAFLAKRGIGEAAVTRFLLGWNPGENGKTACYRPRSAWGLPEKVVDGKSKRLWLPRGIVIPCITDGEVVRVRIRRVDADLSAGFPQRYFVAPGARMDRLKADCSQPSTAGSNGIGGAWVVVETELDAAMIWEQAGDVVGVMAMGTSHAKPDPACHEALSDAARILVALDGDKAGVGGKAWWEDQYASVEWWPVPAGKDPGEAFAAGVDIRAWVLAGLPPVFRVKKRSAESSVLSAEKRQESAKGEPAGLPESVLELAGLLRKHPVRIENTRKRLRIIEPEAWERTHDTESRRISTLVFQDREVGAYLSGHRPGILSGGNFISGGVS